MGELKISETIFPFKLTSLIGGGGVVRGRFSGHDLQLVIRLVFRPSVL